jgi:hypothetical protein
VSGAVHLAAVAQGRRPEDDGLLGNTRCAWGRDQLLSEESILAAFRSRPAPLGDAPLCIETAMGVALIGRDGALVADLYDGRIGRMWRVDDLGDATPEPAIDVAFDPDMRQERGCLHFRAEDHPTLDADAVEPLLAAARDLIERRQADGALRVRGFVVRAFGGAGRCAALLSLHTLGNETSRSAGFGHAVVALGSDGPREVIEPRRPRAWTPRF